MCIRDRDYLDLIDRDGAAVNVAMLAGHAYMREACGHMDKYTPVSEAELTTMEAAFIRALDQGCFGISYGIRYVPGIDRRELERTAAVCRGRDGLIAAHIRSDAGQGHPRAAGSFPRLLAQFVRTGKLSLYEAVRMMTAMPADKLGLSNKGSLQVGADADVVIFDPDRVRELATTDQPTSAGEGIDYVFIGGELAARDCRVVRGDLGRSVRKL